MSKPSVHHKHPGWSVPYTRCGLLLVGDNLAKYFFEDDLSLVTCKKCLKLANR